MICLLQRVTQAKVVVAGETLGQIEHGLMVLVGFQKKDQPEQLQKMCHKLLHYRVFSDDADKMNLNIQQVKGNLLLVPQFTLAADTQKGLRPSFSHAAEPKIAQQLFEQFVTQITQTYQKPQTGQFGADMQVTLTNDGPVTFWLEV